MKLNGLIPALKICQLIVLSIFMFHGTQLQAQADNSVLIESIIAEIKLNKGRTMGRAPAKMLHVYSVEIPENAVILKREKDFNTEISPVYVTFAYRSSNYKIEKIKAGYDVVVYNEPINANASFKERSDKYEKQIIWYKEEQSKEFKNTLDELKSLKESDFESLFGTEDKFPSGWK